MTLTGGDPRVLTAAAKIRDAAANLGVVDRRVADEALRDCPALATDPRLAGPVLADCGLTHRRAAQVLTAAGGEDLQDAAERLAGWAYPVVTLTDLEQRLQAWLPEVAVAAPTATLVRRLLCDAAGLAATPWSTHAVSVVALEAFARAAIDLADDAELINEQALQQAVAAQGWDDAVLEALCEVCGFVRLFGCLAVRQNRVSLSKAALLYLGRSVSRHEVAERTGLTSEDVGLAFTTCDSIIRTGYGRWAAHRDPRFAKFADAVAELTDDAGLIDEPRLAALAAQHGWTDILGDFVACAGYVRLNGQLAASDTHSAKTMAALTHLGGGGVPIERVAKAAELSTAAAASAARRLKAVRVEKGVCRIVADQLSLTAIAGANADDVGLIDIDAFATEAAAHDYTHNPEQLVTQCRLVALFDSYALKKTTSAAVKAALLHLGRPATPAEVQQLTKRTRKAVSHALVETPSIVRVGRRWSIDTPDGALGKFAAAAADEADDVGLINEQDLRQFANKHDWSFDELVKACDLTRVGGRLALDQTQRAVTKAALLDAGRPVSSHELAATTGLTAARVANVLASVASVTRIRPSMWATTDLADGAYARFGAALRLCGSDDAGLLNEPQLRAIAQQQRWHMDVDELIKACGLPRLFGTLAMADTVAAAAKAALLKLGRPATLHELADITGHKYGAINAALGRVDSVRWIYRGVRGERGLLAVSDPPGRSPDAWAARRG